MKLIDQRSRQRLSLKKRLVEELGIGVIGFVCIAFLLALIAIPVNALQGVIVPWMIEHLPWLFAIAALGFSLSSFGIQIGTLLLIAILPLSIVMLIPRKTRRFAGYGLVYTSQIVLSHVLLLSIIATVNFAGVLWLIVGLLLFGAGVIEIAFLTALYRSEWSIAISILLGCVIGWIFYTLSDVLIAQSSINRQ